MASLQGIMQQLTAAVDSSTTDIGSNYAVKPAKSYALRAGPATNIYYEDQQGTIPIIGSDPTIRSFSPFTISVLPPLLYLQDPDLLFGQQAVVGGKDTPPINLGIIGNAAVRNLPDFRNTVKRLRSAAQDNSQTTGYAIAPATSAARKVVGGRSSNRPIGGSGGNTSNADNQNVQYAITDKKVARDIADQLNRILNVPPLTMYINPTSFGISFNKIQQYQERSRSQYIYQTWGEEQPKLSISGRIGAFLAGTAGNRQAPSGVQYANKRNSASFQQLMNLLTFFKNNGYIQDTLGGALAPQLIGILSIEYDQMTYLGYFDSFQWAEVETAQNGGLEFSFEYTVTQMYDNAQSNTVRPLKSPTPSPSDPRYGAEPINAGAAPTATTPQPNALPQVVGFIQQPAAFAARVSQTTAPTSDQGFRLPAAVPPAAQGTVPIQPFFDPRRI